MSLLNISDKEWFDMNLNPEQNKAPLGFTLPSLPPEELQRMFTGRAGKANLEQAFAFYLYVRSNYLEPYLSSSDITIMDLGAGWGRIARFFLRDVTNVENMWCVDPFSVAIDCMKKTNFPGKIVQSQPLPPIPEIAQTRFDVIYAYSVFSHLSEEYFKSWVTYLISLLKDNGVLIFTTRGSRFIDYIEKNSIKPAVFQNYQELRKRYSNGEFLWFRDRGSSAELSGDFFGETFIPRQYVEKELSSYFLNFTEEAPNVDQAVVVLKKNEI